MTVVAMCAVVTMAAKYRVEKEGLFEMVATRHINVMNDAGKVVVTLSANDDGNGMIRTRSAKGNDLVDLTSTEGGNSTVTTYQSNGKPQVRLGSTGNGGLVGAYNKTDEGYAVMAMADNGGLVEVTNNTGEIIGQIISDKDGNGVVGAYNRKGKGRTLQPGP